MPNTQERKTQNMFMIIRDMSIAHVHRMHNAHGASFKIETLDTNGARRGNHSDTHSVYRVFVTRSRGLNQFIQFFLLHSGYMSPAGHSVELIADFALKLKKIKVFIPF